MVFLLFSINIQVIFSFFWNIDQLSPFFHSTLVPCTFRHPNDLPIWGEVGSGVKLHDQLIIPLGELLGNKCINSTCFEVVIYSWIVIFILLDVLPVNPYHVTNNRLLVKQNCLIKVLLFLSVKPVVNNSSSPDSIWIRLSP